jgi:nitrogen fixation negative regulator NifL
MSAAGYFIKDMQSGVLLIANDITHQRRRYEQARLNAVRALMVEQQLVQGMREVMSGAIFQLQGPLNVMGAAVSMMERQDATPNNLQEPIKQVIDAGQTAIDRLKASLPSPTDESVTSVNVNELIREVWDLSAEALLKEGIEVTWRPEPNLPTVLGRASALRSMIKYLIDNAIFSIKDKANSREILIVTHTSDANDVVLEITDSGIGFDQDILIKAFEPFFTAWNKTRCRPGMGLSLARQIIMDQGGMIQIGNVMTGGAKIEVTFTSTIYEGLADYDQ